MSASRSEYPERPKKNPKKSSASGGGKRRSWLQKAVAGANDRKEKEKDAKLDLNGCSFGHTKSVLSAFLAKYRMNKVPLHEWGKKGRTLHV